MVIFFDIVMTAGNSAETKNQFPCQRIWREIESKDTSLDLPEVR
jgi:hypothetical protein